MKKERWTITFDRDLKTRVQKEADKLHVYPVQLLETLVRERLNPFGFQSVQNSIHYVQAIRQTTARKSNKAFLSEMKKWQNR